MEISPEGRSTLNDLVTANRILARLGVVDAFGHISVRHPDHADRYVMSCSRAPEQVVFEDFVGFDLSGEPITPESRPLYAERAIHSEIYRARPEINSVCHNHAPATIPFGVTRVPMRPIGHVAAPMGYSVPVWDIRETFGDSDLLVTRSEVAKSLIAAMGDSPTVLMSGHGSTVATHSIRATVLTSVYMNENAKLLTTALLLDRDGVRYLSEGEVRATTERQFSPLALDRAWNAWVGRIEQPPL
jgi:ribulose-5-phosphate 4-epimerase/fuculose-1-phosphate aldolase